jgi:hypothetical protein
LFKICKYVIPDPIGNPLIALDNYEVLLPDITGFRLTPEWLNAGFSLMITIEFSVDLLHDRCYNPVKEAAMTNSSVPSYEVLSPWAEADPIPLHGLAPRLEKLDGKKIGLLCNNKRAAPIMLDATERLIKENFPTASITKFFANSFSVSSLEKNREGEFNDWLKGLDAVIAAVGD